jgi:uncharacterized membrane protein
MLLFALPALGSALGYASDAVFAKLALEGLPVHAFVVLAAGLYAVLAAGIVATHAPFYRAARTTMPPRQVAFALVSIAIGTLAADYLMWTAIRLATRAQTPAVMAVIHSAPVFAVALVALVFRKALRWQAAVGVLVTCAGVAATLYYSQG